MTLAHNVSEGTCIISCVSKICRVSLRSPKSCCKVENRTKNYYSMQRRMQNSSNCYTIGHSNIIHCFSSPARLLWRHPLPKHPTSLFTSAELVPRLLEVWGKTGHALFAAHNISGSKTMVFLRANHCRDTTRKCCNNCFDMYKCK